MREAWEETGIRVRPHRVLWIEDLERDRFKMCKIWMLCDLVGGEVMPTDGARAEGIIEAGWFRKDQLGGETVYPPPLTQHYWSEFRSNAREARCLPSRIADF